MPQTMTEEREFLSAEQVAQMYGCTPMHVFKLAWKGTLPSFKVGRLRRFDRRHLPGVLESTSQTTDQEAHA